MRAPLSWAPGCYSGALNPIPQGSQIRPPNMHDEESFEALGKVAYVNYGLGMTVVFAEVAPEQEGEIAPITGSREPGFPSGIAC